MAEIKKIGMAVGTFGVALGIGFVMQNGDALASRFGGAADEPAPFAAAPPEPELQPVQASLVVNEDVTPVEDLAVDILPTDPMPIADAVVEPDGPALAIPEPIVELAAMLPEAVITPEATTAPVQLASADPDAVPDLGEIDAPVSSITEVDCVPTVMAATADSAMVDLAVSAPCYAGSPFTVHHQGMMFTAMTNDAGVSKVTVPALAEVAVMIVAFDGGDGAVATVTVPDFAEYDRAVLQWQGDLAVMLSAYEGDANYGEPNHIHAGNPGVQSRIADGEGGYLVSLGDASVEGALMAEVYTFPTNRVQNPVDVMLVAEAEITAENCGEALNAQSIQVAPTGDISALDLEMIMPDCDAVGDFLILQNMFEDLTLASR